VVPFLILAESLMGLPVVVVVVRARRGVACAGWSPRATWMAEMDALGQNSSPSAMSLLSFLRLLVVVFRISGSKDHFVREGIKSPEENCRTVFR